MRLPENGIYPVSNIWKVMNCLERSRKAFYTGKRGSALGKYKTILAAGLILAGMPLTGCGHNKEEEKAAVHSFTEPQYSWGKGAGETLTVWGAYPDLERIYMTKAFERYEELTGNQLNLVQMPKDQYAGKMLEAFDGDGEKPDIVLSYGGTSIENYHPDDNFYDFTQAKWEIGRAHV